MRAYCPNCCRDWPNKCGEGVYCEHCGEPQIPRPNPNFKEMAEAVYKHAEEHYEDGGWDVVVECLTVSDIAKAISELTHVKVSTPEQAIEWYKQGPVAIWADRQADARNSAF